MRWFRNALVAVALIASVPLVGFAQDGPGGPRRGGGDRGFGGPRFGGPVMLLMQESVRKELNLAQEQLDKLTELLDEQREAFEESRELSQEERRAAFEDMRKKTNDMLAQLLSGDQLKRIKQIGWQQQGPQAFSDPEVAQALALTDEQQQKIAEIEEESRAAMRKLFEGGGEGNREGMRAKAEELRKQTGERLLAVLTEPQQESWKSLVGEPFKGEMRRPGFGGGQGFGRPGGRARRNNSDN
ncbi:MAG: hypothetical protein K1X74_08395 [Pirellulales bacterium]|nr:hypothetical protein [Pirellulales bacterium]